MTTDRLGTRRSVQVVLVLALAVLLTLCMAVVAANAAPAGGTQEPNDVATRTADPGDALAFVALGACLLMVGAIAGGATRARRDQTAAHQGH